MNIFTKKWLLGAFERAVKTGAQALIALIGTGAVSIISLDWAQMLAITATAMLLSVLTAIADPSHTQISATPKSPRHARPDGDKEYEE